jgi:hypothetical protein
LNLLFHGLGPVKDLPVPTWLFYWGGAVVLVVSFALLGVLWQRPLLARHASGRLAPRGLGGAVLSTPLRVAVQTISVLLLALVFATALLGNDDPFKNFAPTWIYVAFWLGVPLLSVLLGNVWRALSPWRAIADGYVWARLRLGGRPARVEEYPERLGRWPAALALFAFVSLELAYKEPADPLTLAWATAIYTIVTLFGYATFGRETWHARGEGFAVAFGYLARMAPLTAIDGRLRFRWPFTGLAGDERVPGSLAVIAVMLGSVAFDGVSRTSNWQNLVADVKDPFIPDRVDTGELLVMLVNLGALVAFCLVVALAYLACCAVMRRSVAAGRSLVPEFLLSLVPIAFVYALAHYFSLFVTQGQYLWPLLSDPFGRGWDLLGSADYRPNLAIVSPHTVWYVQAGSLIAGHVVGLAVAHDRAVTLFPDRRRALRSQYAMLALMVLYTVGGLYILSRS